MEAVAMPVPVDGAVVVDVEALYRTHYRDLVRLASILVDDLGTCEELAQDAFVALQVGRGRLRDPAAAPAYLRSAVLNGARSHLRRRQTRRRFEALPGRADLRRGAGTPERADLAERAGSDPNVEADQRRTVLSALRTLPDRQREVLVLRYYLDLSEAEIAATLGISPGSVKTHAHRGLAALATHIGDAP